MTVFVDDPDFVLHVGDALDVLAGLPDESVHCVVTSPPYWGLRDYGTGSWDGGNEHCDHKAPPTGGPNPERYTPGGGEMFRAANDKLEQGSCRKCGARRTDHQLGLEPTPDQYVANMVGVFRQVRRVLRRDGTCWLNIGDSYAQDTLRHRRDVSDTDWAKNYGHVDNRVGTAVGGLKAKDLCGIPWRLAFALQADGWYLRSDIIWSKPNPMPESVTDRPTKAHEYLFLLTKAPRYYFDQDAIREDYTPDDRLKRVHDHHVNGSHENHAAMSNGKERWAHAGRNKRSVWEIATQPYPEAHFATFPQALVEPCVLAGTSERGCCPVCGAPWERETEATKYEPPVVAAGVRNVDETRGDKTRKLSGAAYSAQVQRQTTGWRPTCDHGTTTFHGETVPCTVLDPFMGSGTTALVARRLGRRTVGIELSPEYASLAAEQLQQLSLFADA